MSTDSNGKTTAGLVIQIVAIIGSIATPIILMYSKLNVMETKMQEVETQFLAADNMRNVNLAGQMRYNALMWQRIYGEPFPAVTYFPEISNRSGK